MSKFSLLKLVLCDPLFAVWPRYGHALMRQNLYKVCLGWQHVSLPRPSHGAVNLTVTGNAVTLWCDVQDSILVVGPLGDTIQYPVPPETILVTEVCHRLLVRTGTAVTKRYFVVCPVRKCRHSTRPLGLDAVFMAAFPSPAHVL